MGRIGNRACFIPFKQMLLNSASPRASDGYLSLAPVGIL